MLEVQQSTTNLAGNQRLEQIRASLHGGSVAGQITGGNTTAAKSTSPSVQQEIEQRVRQAKSQPQNPQAGTA